MDQLIKIIKTKVFIMDIYNKQTKGEFCHKVYRELSGIRVAARCFNFQITLDINPYFYQDAKPSSFDIIELNKEM